MDEEQVLARAWRSGVPGPDRVILEELPDDVRTATLARLKAVLEAEEPGRDIGRLASDLKMSRVAFFRLRSRWRQERSLRNLVPYLRRVPRRLGPRSASGPEVGKRIREIVIGAHSGASTSSLARAVVEALGGELSLQTATRLVRVERAKLALEPAYVAKHFGEEVLLDLSAVSLAEEADPPIPITVAVALERSTRLIIGHAAGRAADGLGLQLKALDHAILSLEELELSPVRRERTCEAEIVLGIAERDTLHHAAEVLRAQPFVHHVASGGGRRFGERLVSLIGHRLHRLRLYPRSTDPANLHPEGKLEWSWPPMSLQNAAVLVEEAVHHHNAPITKVLKRANLREPFASGSAAILNTLTEIRRSGGFDVG